MNRKLSLGVATLVAFSVFAAPAAAQRYPTKPVRFVVPFPPGGGTDTLARIVGQHLSKSMSQSVVIDNRPGNATASGGMRLQSL